MKNYIICKSCVMDTTDPNIEFDANGICNYCNNFYLKILPYWKSFENNERKLEKLIKKIKHNNNKKLNKYDCIIGVSGGVDSSYLVHSAVTKFNLKPLIYHVDAGWNSQIAVENIEKIIDKLDLDLVTDVIYWPEIRDLQLSFFKAGVPHLDTPQDHAFFASIYNYSVKNGYNYILNGGNFSSECIREPLLWHYHASDLYHLLSIQKKFGKLNLKKYPTCDIFKYRFYYKYFKNLNVVQPLNFINYNKSEAINELKLIYDWKEYSHKHYESRFTRFYEGYWLLKKFGYDKRKAHYSSLILTKQMKREEALKNLSVDPISNDEIKKDLTFVADKLNITEDELNSFFLSENKTFKNYKSNFSLINFFTKLMMLLGLEKRIIQ